MNYQLLLKPQTKRVHIFKLLKFSFLFLFLKMIALNT